MRSNIYGRVSQGWQMGLFHVFSYDEERSRFNYAVNVILGHEGGFTNDPIDPGGPTNFGISLRTLKEINPNADIDTIKNLNLEQAIDYYRKQWWEKYHFGFIFDLKLATKIFDLGVNIGAEKAVKLFQMAINSIGNDHIELDGKIGKITISASNCLPSNQLLAKYQQLAKEFYLSLMEKNPKLIKYKNGWLNRAAW